jgi:hypothetical protein
VAALPVLKDNDGRPSLLGVGALALILGWLDSADREDGRSLEQSVRDLLGNPPVAVYRVCSPAVGEFRSGVP